MWLITPQVGGAADSAAASAKSTSTSSNNSSEGNRTLAVNDAAPSPSEALSQREGQGAVASGGGGREGVEAGANNDKEAGLTGAEGDEEKEEDEEDEEDWGLYIRAEEDYQRTKKVWTNKHKAWIEDQARVFLFLLLFVAVYEVLTYVP